MLTDESSRAAALNTNESFIVQAPAGSGKTSLLVQRFINLLAICKNPEECLAITFTKKAACEMRYRVLQTIEHSHPELFNNPNRLKILTIDAFCASLTEKMPVLSRLGVNLNIAEDPRKLYLSAVEQLLKSAYQSDKLLPNLINILKYLDNNIITIKNLLVNMLANREQWLPLIVPIKEHKNLKVILEKNLQIAIEDVLAVISAYLPDNNYQTKIIELAKQAANNLEKNNIINNIIFCKNLTNTWPTANICDLSIWYGLAELLLNKDGSPRKQVNANQGFVAKSSLKNLSDKKIAAELKANMQEILQDLTACNPDFLKKLQQVTILKYPVYDLDNWEFLQSIFCLLPELVAHLIVVFQEQRQVDFAQIALGALNALGTEEEPTDLALTLDYKINHILVDEFQDTSILQFNLLEKLITSWDQTDLKTIFLVGDPMQSIYRFRQANVGLFLRTQEYGIANIKLKKLFLTTNFRSSSVIVNNLNQWFIKIFPKQNDEILGGVAYSMANAKEQTQIVGNNSEIKFFITENYQLEAERIVELINQIKLNHKINNTVNHTIAILVRAKSHAKLIIQALRTANIKFQANDLELLTDQVVIKDLIVLTRAILHIHDLVAWLALLRGPLVGLKLADLHALRENTEDSLYKALQDYKNNLLLSTDAKLRLNYIVPILLEAIAQREITNNLAILIKKTWMTLGGSLFLTNTELELVEDFFYKLLKITDFTSINIIEDLMNEQFVAVPAANLDVDSVQIMTIHKAKGLEFDTVIVPGLARKTLGNFPQLLLWEERFSKKLNKNCLLFATINSCNYEFMQFSEEQREFYEEQRLLYVAMTRAKHNFYGFSSKTTGVNKSFFKFLEPHVEFEELPKIQAKAKANFINHNMFDQKPLVLRRIPSDWYMLNALKD